MAGELDPSRTHIGSPIKSSTPRLVVLWTPAPETKAEQTETSDKTHFQSPDEPFIGRGVSSLGTRDEVYEITRAHINDGSPFYLIVDLPNMTLVPGEKVETSHGVCRNYSLMDGSVNPHTRLRFPTDSIEPPLFPQEGTIFVTKGEFDTTDHSGLTVTEVFSK